MSELPLVEVTWHDAYTMPNNSWIDLDDISDSVDNEPYVVRSVGFLIADVKRDYLVIAQSSSDEQVDSVLCVPVGMVRKLRVIS